MDFNNSGDMFLYVQNLERQARRAQEAQENLRRQAQEFQEKERLLLRQIEERDQKIEEDRQQIEERDQQIEEDRRQIEERDQQIEEDRRQIEEDRQQLQLQQRTVIRNYIRLCQSIFYDAMELEDRIGRKVKGALTKVKGKYHPRKLEKMRGFKEELQQIFDEACGLFPPEHRGFDSEETMRSTLEKRVRRIGHESTLTIFVLDHIEIPLKKILEELRAVDENCVFLARDVEILFELEPQEISAHMGGPSEEPPQSDINIEIEPVEVPPATPLYRTDLGKFHPDRICLRSVATQDITHEVRTMLYVCEYKIPQLVAYDEVREAMEFLAPRFDQTIDKSQKARRKVQKIFIQLYHYMMKGYTEFGILNTGRVIIFCRINWKNPGTLHYHVADPYGEVAAADEADKAFNGAVGQYLAFTLLALRQSDQTGQERRQIIVERLPIWAGGSSNAPPLPDAPPPPNASPSSGASSSGAPAGASSSGAPAGSAPSEGGTGASGSSASRAEESDTQRQSAQTDIGTKSNQLGGRTTQRIQDRQYCSQKCFLGLVRGDNLDPTCPNVTLHCQGEAGEAGYNKRHPISHSEWLSLLLNQLKRSLYDGIKYQGVFGARGILFKVTLLAYGYTFVSKGAVSANIRHLQHEADIYKQLEPIQGVHVPVFLGAIDLREMNKFYWIYPEIRVVHFMFLSWGGYCIDRYEMAQFEISLERLEEQAEKTMVSVHDKGVIHQDVRWENVLFNPETNGIMMIDFERADLQKTHETRKSNKRTLDQMRHAEMREIAFAVSQELPTPRHVC
ncbi:hypothetical protein E4U09_007337 [Claviceps aff. purpurea]|uniref:Protein kinase domain-containing protein n=1 Tax=Claviceps aff. purpurea TaxID=1967640 RepID=A0A9P7TVN2_9HYPO|nr:hypothetical protein E4U09_007337 [Claviceps aff. purpurea]